MDVQLVSECISQVQVLKLSNSTNTGIDICKASNQNMSLPSTQISGSLSNRSCIQCFLVRRCKRVARKQKHGLLNWMENVKYDRPADRRATSAPPTQRLSSSGVTSGRRWALQPAVLTTSAAPAVNFDSSRRGGAADVRKEGRIALRIKVDHFFFFPFHPQPGPGALQRDPAFSAVLVAL